jgi:hypothetical protein
MIKRPARIIQQDCCWRTTTHGHSKLKRVLWSPYQRHLEGPKQPAGIDPPSHLTNFGKRDDKEHRACCSFCHAPFYYSFTDSLVQLSRLPINLPSPPPEHQSRKWTHSPTRLASSQAQAPHLTTPFLPQSAVRVCPHIPPPPSLPDIPISRHALDIPVPQAILIFTFSGDKSISLHFPVLEDQDGAESGATRRDEQAEGSGNPLRNKARTLVVASTTCHEQEAGFA